MRFLLYANDWDVEAIIANRPHTRRPENRSPEDTGLVVRAGWSMPTAHATRTSSNTIPGIPSRTCWPGARWPATTTPTRP